MFFTHHNLQGSQTVVKLGENDVSFLPIIIYKVLKHNDKPFLEIHSFLPIIIYKVLKPNTTSASQSCSFLPIIIYKVLKPYHHPTFCPSVSYPS